MYHTILLTFCTLGFIYLCSSKAGALLMEEIIGGYAANSSTLTFQVSIKAKHVHVCCGGVLNHIYVVGAARCLISKRLFRFHQKSYKVLITTNFLSKNETIASALVEKVFVPLTFNLTSMASNTVFEREEDFVILKLRKPLTLDFTRVSKELRLPETLQTSNFYTIAGYGVHALSDDGRYLPSDGKLRYAEVELISNEVCGTIYNKTIPNFLLCATVVPIPGTVRGTCEGDIGTPLIQNYESIVGVLVQHPASCNDNLQPSLYIKISHYLSFIEHALRGDTSNMRVFRIRKIDYNFRFEEE